MAAEKEFKGRNVQKAVERAAETLGIPPEDLKYDILSHGSTGIFGLAGVKKARISVHIEEVLSPEKEMVEPDPDARMVDKDIAGDVQEQPNLDEIESRGEAILRRMVDAISPESTITVHKDERRLKFLIEGGQSGILIGKRGQTLEAMQLILDKAVRRFNGHHLRLQVDVEGYLAKKKAGLIQTAERLAQKVAAKRRPSSIGYLNAQDRRIVHLALKNNHKVRTKSVGEGPFRKLMIYPRHNPRTKI